MIDRQQISGLQTLLAYGRGNGKTRTLIYGIANSKSNIGIVTPFMRTSEIIADECREANPNCKVKPYNMLDVDRIRGTQSVLVFDHTVVEFLLGELLKCK